MFLSRCNNALDAKGRISVPAELRAFISSDVKRVENLQSKLAQEQIQAAIDSRLLNWAGLELFSGIIVWPSVEGAYLEGGGISLLKSYQDMLEQMDPFDDVRLAFEHSIFAQCRRLNFDANGRVSLPKDLASYAGLSDRGVFVGLGRRFQIWNPEDYDAHAKAARDLAKQNRHHLRLASNSNGPYKANGDDRGRV